MSASETESSVFILRIVQPRAVEEIRCSDRANFFLNALVLCFYLEHVQRITFCRCFLIFDQAVFCVDDGVVLWLKIKKNPTPTYLLLKPLKVERTVNP